MTDTAVEPIVPGSLRDTIRREIDGYLRDPLAFPSEFVSWIPQRVEQVGIITPRSNVTGAYTTADTVSGLGAAVHGRPCMVRAGAAPYHFVQMTYDDVYGKWVSPSVLNATLGTFTGAAAGVGVWSDLVSAGAYTRPQIPGFKALYDSGLRPQLHVMAVWNTAGPGNTHRIRPAIYELNSGDTSLAKVAHGTEITWTSATQLWRISPGWSEPTFTAVPGEAEAVLSIQHESVSAIAAYNISVLMRWVADPV